MKALWFLIGIFAFATLMLLLPLIFLAGCSTPEKEIWECCEDHMGVPFCFRVDESFAQNKNNYSVPYLENHDRANAIEVCKKKRVRE